MSKNAQMMKVCLPWKDARNSFKLIPITNDCPFLEGRFNLDEKMLILISKVGYQQLQMIPKLDDNGEIQYKAAGKGQPTSKATMKQERKLMDSFYDFSITERPDIEKIVDLLTGESNDLDEYYKVDETKLAATDGKAPEMKMEVVKDGK